MYIFDTDSLSEVFEHGQQSLIGRRAAAVPKPRESLLITIVTVEEMLWGRADAIKKAVKQVNQDDRVFSKLPDLCRFLEETLADLRAYKTLPFNNAANHIFQSIPKNIRRGRLNDARIASIALAYDFTVVTKNIKDFAPLKEACGVKYIDWSARDLE